MRAIPEGFFGKLQEDLKRAGMETEAGRYFADALKYGTLISVFFWLVYALASEELMAGAACCLLVFAASVSAFLYYPKMRMRRRGEMIEKDLPFALMAMSVELNMGIPFERVIENAAKENYGLVSLEFGKMAAEIRERGASIQEGLFGMSERVDSLMLKRCVSQLVGIYEHGGSGNGGEAIRRLAVEQLAKQRAVSKEFSGKLVVFSLMFIAVSAIVPALFQSFVVIGSMFMEMDFTPLQVLLIAVVGFPLVDLGVLLYIRGKTPVFMRE